MLHIRQNNRVISRTQQEKLRNITKKDKRRSLKRYRCNINKKKNDDVQDKKNKNIALPVKNNNY